MILVILGFLAVALVVIYVIYQFNKLWLLKRFKKGNVIVYGNKGKGKDLVFQKIIEWRKNEHYYSNLDYGYNYHSIALKNIDTKNTFDNFITENIVIEQKNEYEKKDIYISDCGVYLPSQHDNKLHKLYGGLPITYALSRHMYANNIHTNVQNIEREWKALRELGDTFVWCRNTLKIGPILLTSIIVYDRYQTAVNKILPLKLSIFDKDENLQKKQFDATNGTIKSMYIINFTNKIKYDTRAFHKKMFGVSAPKG